jgi:hypothetical protein
VVIYPNLVLDSLDKPVAASTQDVQLEAPSRGLEAAVNEGEKPDAQADEKKKAEEAADDPAKALQQSLGKGK